MTPSDIRNSVKEDKFTYLGKGLYVLSDFSYACLETDATYLFPDSVYCLISALEIHEMTLRMSLSWHLASPYKKAVFSNSYNKYTFHEFKDLHLKLGVETILMDGEPVFVYDREKTICDILIHRDLIQDEDIDYAVAEYKKNIGNFEKLRSYGEILGVFDLLKVWFEDVF